MPNSNLVNAGTEGATLGIVFKASRKDPNVDREALSFFQQNG